jgi:ribA/ribD-fused uncharacterized protein
MMYRKAVLFSDPETAAEILLSVKPRVQKALGRGVKDFNEEVWIANREKIVEDGNFWKFGGDREEDGMEKEMLRGRNLILKTGERLLVEASPRDRIWGIGFGETNAEARVEHWGLNLLGKCLMRARHRIRQVDEGGKETIENEVLAETEEVDVFGIDVRIRS